MSKTKIDWTQEVWNPIRGCSRVSAGCQNCYAERMASRFSGCGQPYEGLAKNGRWTGEVRLVEEKLLEPLRWRKPRIVFTASMSDPFHAALTDDQIDRIFAVKALASAHTFQSLTKRPRRARDYLSSPDRPYAILRAIDHVKVDMAMRNVAEEWRAVPSAPSYQVSNHGNVRRDGSVLVQSKHTNGYRQIALCEHGKPRTALVHRMVLEAFDRSARAGEETAHRNGDRTDNRIANLRWTSKSGNMAEAARHGTAGVWMKSRATLTHDEVMDIRATRALGTKLDIIAERYGSNRQQISAIATGKIYKPAPLSWPLPNVWLGVSVEDQKAADERIPLLLKTPAEVRFISYEPALGAVDCSDMFSRYRENGSTLLPAPDWVIAGCESGPGRRPARDEWFRSLREQCVAAGVPYFLKQMEVEGEVQKMPKLDGAVWGQYPPSVTHSN